MNEKQIKLCSENYGMAFWLFYMIIPFVMTRAASDPVFMNLVVVLLAAYLSVKFLLYRSCFTLRQYLFDSLCMLAGLSFFYWSAIHSRASSPRFDLTMYLMLAFTYLPTAIRLESRKRRLMTAR